MKNLSSFFLLFFTLNISLFAFDHEKAAIDLFTKLNKDNLKIVGDYYDTNALFIDPIGRHEGLESITKYYKSVYSGAQDVSFTFSKSLIKEDNLVLFWSMKLKSESLGDKEIVVDGISDIIFDPTSKKIIYHQDFFDSAALFYKNIPILKSIIKYIENRIKGN